MKQIRLLFTLIILVFSLSGMAQGNTMRYSLKLDTANHTITGSAHFTLVNSSLVPLTHAAIHLPPRALQLKNSLLLKQLAEHQNNDVLFADSIQRGSISLINGNIENNNFKDCDTCEFLSIPLSNKLASGDSINLKFDFTLLLPNAEFNGQGLAHHVYRIADWLPALSPLDSSGFVNYPVTFQSDRYTLKNHYQIQWQLPKNHKVASNAVEQSSGYPKTNLKYFRHYGSGLHFFISKHFTVLPINQNTNLYLTNAEPWILGTANTISLQIADFYEKETGIKPEGKLDWVLLTDKNNHFQSDQLLSIEHPKNAFKYSSSLATAWAESIFRYRMTIDGIRHVWLARGLPHYYKYLFIAQHFPEKKWLPFSNSFLGKFFSLHHFDYAHQNHFFYLYLARQGLDQALSTPADSLTKLNYQAIAQSKAYLAINHLQEYVSPIAFRRSINKYLLDETDNANPASFIKSIQYFANKPTDWFLQDGLYTTKTYDYKIVKFETCPTVTTVTIVNKGELATPYSITGIKDGKPVLTQWYPGHTGKKTFQIHNAEYDEIRVNKHTAVPEYSQRNNKYYNRAALKKTEPIKLQFYYSFEDPKHSQLFWTPTINFNNYDKVLLGVSLDNSSLVQKPFEFIFSPDYSTGTGQLTGSTTLKYNWVTRNSSLFHQITFGMYGRYYHYDKGLAYYRLSPAINFHFKKKFPRSTDISKLRLRLVKLERDVPKGYNRQTDFGNYDSYTVFNINYRYEETKILKPFTFIGDLQIGDDFGKITADFDKRYMLPNKKWLILRTFAGALLYQNINEAANGSNYYQLGLSGTQDYLFDYHFFGRSETNGIYSQQFFTTDGGFKSQTNQFADEWLVSQNLSVPVWFVFGAYADAAFFQDSKNVEFQYDAGIRLALLTDFLELYFPIYANDKWLVGNQHYLAQFRFVLDIDQSNIINRLRRAYY